MAARRSRRQRMRGVARGMKKRQRQRRKTKTGASRTLKTGLGLLGQERATAKNRRARRRQFRKARRGGRIAARQAGRTQRQAARQAGRTTRTMARQARKAAKDGGGIDTMAAMGAGLEMMDDFDTTFDDMQGGFEEVGGGGIMDSPYFWPVVGAAGVYLLFFRKKK